MVDRTRVAVGTVVNPFEALSAGVGNAGDLYLKALGNEERKKELEIEKARIAAQEAENTRRWDAEQAFRARAEQRTIDELAKAQQQKDLLKVTPAVNVAKAQVTAADQNMMDQLNTAPDMFDAAAKSAGITKKDLTREDGSPWLNAKNERVQGYTEEERQKILSHQPAGKDLRTIDMMMLPLEQRTFSREEIAPRVLTELERKGVDYQAAQEAAKAAGLEYQDRNTIQKGLQASANNANKALEEKGKRDLDIMKLLLNTAKDKMPKTSDGKSTGGEWDRPEIDEWVKQSISEGFFANGGMNDAAIADFLEKNYYDKISKGESPYKVKANLKAAVIGAREGSPNWLSGVKVDKDKLNVAFAEQVKATGAKLGNYQGKDIDELTAKLRAMLEEKPTVVNASGFEQLRSDQLKKSYGEALKELTRSGREILATPAGNVVGTFKTPPIPKQEKVLAEALQKKEVLNKAPVENKGTKRDVNSLIEANRPKYDASRSEFTNMMRQLGYEYGGVNFDEFNPIGIVPLGASSLGLGNVISHFTDNLEERREREILTPVAEWYDTGDGAKLLGNRPDLLEEAKKDRIGFYNSFVKKDKEVPEDVRKKFTASRENVMSNLRNFKPQLAPTEDVKKLIQLGKDPTNLSKLSPKELKTLLENYKKDLATDGEVVP